MNNEQKRERAELCQKKCLVLYHNFMYITSEIRYPQNVTSQRGILWLILKANIHTHLKKTVCMYGTCSNVTEQLIILNPLQTNSVNDSKLQKQVGR